MNKEEIIEMIRDDNTPKELIIAQFETAFKYQMDLQKNIDILHNNQNKLIDEIGEQGKEIERLTTESTEWESKCYKYQEIIDEYEKWIQENIKISKAHDNQTAVNIFNVFSDKLKELKEGK